MVMGKEHWVLRLRKALYRLKQAPQAWYFRLHKCLLALGFIKSRHEQVVYLKQSSNYKLLIGIYVDDLIVIGSRSEDVNSFKKQMKDVFEMSDLGSLSTYLGIEINQRPNCICLSQGGYAHHILEKKGVSELQSLSEPS